MNPKITPDHLARSAVVYVRQSTPMQVSDHLEGQRRQYALADTARELGFMNVETIDEDLGRSGSGLVERPGFQRLVASVCTGAVGAVLCLEASRLARNGRDWHHLVDLCALVGTLLIDYEGAYDPRLVNDRLLLGLKGTMSEYELSLLRQRGLAARDAKAQRGELRVGLPPGYCWDETGHVDFDADEQVVTVMRLLFRKFAELGSARQVLLWLRTADLRVPVVRAGIRGTRIVWQRPAYHNVLLPLRNPTYAGAYVFGRTENRTRIAEGRALKTAGHKKPRERWSVLIRDHHPQYITWDDYERNQVLLSENAHMQKRAARKAGRGGRALLTGLLRCGRCGRMLHVFYGMGGQHAHRYMCRRETPLDGQDIRCVGIGGVRVDRAVSAEMLAAVAPHAVEAALLAVDRAEQAGEEVRRAVAQELEAAGYDARLAARRYEAVDPDKRLVARTLEARWEAALEHERQVRERLTALEAEAAAPAEGGSRAFAESGRESHDGMECVVHRHASEAATHAHPDRGDHRGCRRRASRGRVGHSLGGWAPYRSARRACARGRIPEGASERSGSASSAGRSVARSRARGDAESNALSQRRRGAVDHDAGAGTP